MKGLIITILVFAGANINPSGAGDGNRFHASRLAVSDNGKFVFVLISRDSLDDYIFRTRKSWEVLDLSPQELEEYNQSLADFRAEELRIRSLYPTSGLFLKSAPNQPLWKAPSQEVERWGQEMDDIFVADDGTYVVGYNPEVAETESGLPNRTETALFIYSANFGYVSYRVSQLTNPHDPFAKTSEGYYWAKRHPNLEKATRMFTFVKQDDTRVKLSLESGEILYPSSKKHITCLGMLMLLFLVSMATGK